MKRMSRRDVLKAASAAPVLAACGVPPGDDPKKDPADDEPLGPYEAPGTEDDAAFPTGVIVGDARRDGALLSVLTAEPNVTFVVLASTADGWREAARLDGVAPTDGSAQVSVRGLAPDTQHSVVAYAADGERRSRVGRFRTAMAPGTSRVVRFGATSCLGGNLPWPNLSHVAARGGAAGLDFFCLLGDTIYADGVPASGIPLLWRTALAVEGMRAITGSTSVVATWDDHEVDNNWSYADPGTPERVQAALTAFHAALPVENGIGPLGIYRQLSWGDTLDLFVLDSRGERRDGNYLAPKQMEWFKAALASSTARFKVVLNSVPMTDLADLVGNIEADDRWQGYPVQRAEILEHIAATGVTGVVWLSGDFHLGSVGKVDLPGGPADTHYEILCGPTGSPINPGINFIQPTDRIPTLIGEHNAVHFEADPDAGTLLVRVINDDDVVIAEHTLVIA